MLGDRGLRERIHRASVGRGLGGEHDTRALVIELARCRAQRAALLGFDHHGAYVAATAAPAPAQRSGACSPGWRRRRWRTPASRPPPWNRSGAGSSRRRPWPRGTGRTSANCCAPRGTPSMIPSSGPTWSWNGCCTPGPSRRPPSCTGSPSASAVTWSATTPTCGSSRSTRPTEPRWGCSSPTSTPAPEGGGGWCDTLVDQNHLLGQRAVVVFNLNLAKPPTGQPTLMAWDDVIVLFHEFGHVLHSRVPGQVPVKVGHRDATGLRRVPVTGERDLGAGPDPPTQLRDPLRDR